MKIAKTLGIAFVFAWYFFGGIAHFTQTEFFVSILWPSFPMKEAVVLISGVIEIAMALAIWVPNWRPLMGWIITAFTLAVTPVNVYHWLNPEHMPDAEPWMLTLRLVIQVILIAIIWWSTDANKLLKRSAS